MDQSPQFTLVVIRPFFFPATATHYKHGDEITDPELVAVIEKSDFARHCNRVAA
jgi:hypothetical protein